MPLRIPYATDFRWKFQKKTPLPYHKMIGTGIFKQNSSVSQILLFLAGLGGRATNSHARSLPRIHKHDPLTRLQGCLWPCEWVSIVNLRIVAFDVVFHHEY